MVRQLGLASREISLLDEENYQSYLVRPGLFYEELVAIEAKATEKIRPEHLKGLKAISDLKGVRRRLYDLRRKKQSHSGRH